MSNEPLHFGAITIGECAFYTRSDADTLVFVAEGREVFSGKPEDLAALIRDGKRFRRMEKAHACGEGDVGWCELHPTSGCAANEFHPIEVPLAEIADALPEVES